MPVDQTAMKPLAPEEVVRNCFNETECAVVRNSTIKKPPITNRWVCLGVEENGGRWGSVKRLDAVREGV